MLKVNKLKNQESGNFFLIAGPCVVEGRDMALEIAEKVKEITDRLQIPYIFKASYRKANRTKLKTQQILVFYRLVHTIR